MKCEEIRDLLDLYLDAELPEEQKSKVNKHLLRCSLCGGELQALEQARSLLREAVPQAEPSPAFRERTNARLLDALSAHLRGHEEAENGRQWILPFPANER